MSLPTVSNPQILRPVCAQLYLEHEGEGYEGVDVCEVDVDHALLKTTTSQGIHRY